MMPGQQAQDREDRQQEILAESQLIKQCPQPDVGPIPGRAPAENEHTSLIGRNERKREHKTHERCAGDAPVAVLGSRFDRGWIRRRRKIPGAGRQAIGCTIARPSVVSAVRTPPFTRIRSG